MSATELTRVETVDRPPTPSQLRAFRALPDNAAPDWPAVHHTLPASHYVSQERYDIEQRSLFGRLPVPIAPSAMLAPNSFVCRDGYGTPIIVTRDKSGAAHAFLNACRHRGSRLTRDQDAKKGGLIVCPYHAWSYDLAGRLKGVPREDVFADLDKEELGLVRLRCQERGGIIWVKLDRDADEDFSHVSRELTDDLDAMNVAGMHLFAHRRHQVEGNWKLVIDTFLEGYHVIRLHANTLGQMFEDAVVEVDRLGNHLRQASGRLNFARATAAEREHSLSQMRRAVTFVYTLVPNGVLVCSPDYVNLLLLQPSAPGKTLVDNFMLTDRVPDDRLREKWTRSLDLTDGQAFPEDFFAAAESFAGLSTGATPHVILGGMEQAIKTYHDLIDGLIAQGELAA